MATYTMTQPVETRTLVAATADTATMAGGFSAVLVFNQDATAYIYVRADGTAAVSAGAGSYPVPPGKSTRVPLVQAAASTPTVSIISSATPTYSIIGVQAGQFGVVSTVQVG
jgi:hypothetical protein